MTKIIGYCAKIKEQESPDYVEGMAPRTDAVSRLDVNSPASARYLLMMGHARALEIELMELQHSSTEQEVSE